MLSYAVRNQVRNIMPSLATKKINDPKTGTIRLTFIPADMIAGETLPIASIESNAPIIPIIWPRKPQTRANKLIELIKLIVLTMFPFLRKPLTIRTNTKIKINKSGNMKPCPPSLKRDEIDKNIIGKI
jgi:hypothetical protein